MQPDPDAIANMLTLRYNPEKRPVRLPLKPRDFVPRKQEDNIEARTTSIIRQEILKMARKKRPRCISLSLSGGIDSALTVAMLRSTLPDVKLECISIGFGDADDEVEQAREIARAHDCNFNEMKLSNILADLPKLISAVKEPRWNLYHYYALEKGRAFSDIFYSGDGGDELFGGYTFRYSKFLSLLPKKPGWKERVRAYLDCHERDWVPDQAAVFGPKIRFSWDRIYGLLRPHFDNGLEPLEQVFLADFNGKLLYDWMPANRAFEKLLGMEIRSVFLTQAMTRFATHVPWQLKYDPATGVGKLPLRSILASGRGPRLEPVKKGFAVNLVSLWNRNAREIVGRYVNPGSETVRAGLVNPAWISKAMDRMRNEPDPRYVNKMLGILALEVWHRLFVSRTIKGGQKL